MSPSQQRAAVEELRQKFSTSERRACAVLGVPRSTQRYQVQPRTDEVAICQRLRAMVRQRPRFGYRRLTQLLKREGWHVNSKRIHRLCPLPIQVRIGLDAFGDRSDRGHLITARVRYPRSPVGAM